MVSHRQAIAVLLALEMKAWLVGSSTGKSTQPAAFFFPIPFPTPAPAAVCITCLLGIVLLFVETASPPLGGSQHVLPGNLLFYKGFTTSGSCLREELHSWAFRVCFLITREVV